MGTGAVVLHQGPDREPTMNLSAMIEKSARYFKDKPAIVFGSRQYTYAEFNTAVNRVARYLLDRGLRPGDRAAIFAGNRPEWAAVYYGIVRAGGVAVCLSASYKKKEIEPLVNDSGARWIFFGPETEEQLPDREEIPATETLGLERDPALVDLFAPTGNPDGKPVMADRGADDPCAILYTGGTTGTPKGAVLSHGNILFTAQNVCYHERTSPQDRSVCFMPLNHVFGGNHIMNSIFYGCGTLVLHRGFDMDRVLASLAENAVTRFFAVPTIYIRMLDNPDSLKGFETVSYCFSAATSMASEIVRRWSETFGLTIHESYGMTETASLVTFNHLYQHRIGSVGTLAGVVEARLVDPEDNPVPVGETGEIVIRGPNIMTGYFNKPKETAHAMRGGWLHSGDIGRFDEEGYLYIVDRIKDLVISGGLNVYPSEVEEILYTHPAVDECVVVGMPDQEYGEAVTAFVILRRGCEAAQEELIAHCKSRMASYKAPKKVVYVQDLPKTPTGKILRRAIREKF